MFVPGFLKASIPGVSSMTEVTIREQMTRMTSSAIAIPFQFLCGGLLPTSSYENHRKRESSEHDSGDRPNQQLLPLRTQGTGQRQKPLPISDCHELLPSPAACSTPGSALSTLVLGRDGLHKEADMVPCLEEYHPHKIPR